MMKNQGPLTRLNSLFVMERWTDLSNGENQEEIRIPCDYDYTPGLCGLREILTSGLSYEPDPAKSNLTEEDMKRRVNAVPEWGCESLYFWFRPFKNFCSLKEEDLRLAVWALGNGQMGGTIQAINGCQARAQVNP